MASPAFLSKTDGVNLTEFREYHQRAGISSLIRDSTRIQALQTELSETKIQLETERKRSASTATRLSAVEAECQRTRDEATALSDELSETKRQLEAERNRTARERSQAELLSQQLAIMRADLERAKAQITSLCADVSAGQLECKKAKLDAQSRFEELALANAKADQCASELLSTKKRLEIEAQEKAALSVELEHTVDQLATEKNEAATVAGRCSLLQAGFCEIAALLERPFETAQMLSSG
jgi:chromosome segregation ATPase